MKETPDRIAIIGTREPDVEQTEAAFKLAYILTRHYGIIVRTGAATGIDQAAMDGANPKLLEVVLPWPRYNHRLIPPGAKTIVADRDKHTAWFDSVLKLHPAAHRLESSDVLLHARNYGIIEGTILVVALPDSHGGGGTGQGIRVAKHLNIPLIQANKGYLKEAGYLISQVQEFLQARIAP